MKGHNLSLTSLKIQNIDDLRQKNGLQRRFNVHTTTFESLNLILLLFILDLCQLMKYEMFDKLHALFVRLPFYKELVDNKGYTLPFICVAQQNVNAMSFLIKEGFDILENINGTTVFHTAAEIGSVDILSVLSQHKPESINIVNNKKSTPLIVASWQNHTDAVEYLLQQDGIEINVQNNNGSTALHLACSTNNNVKVVSLLLDRNELNEINSNDLQGYNPLHYACQNNNIQIVSMLLDHKSIDVDAACHDKQLGDALATDLSIKRMIKRKRESKVMLN